MKQQQLHNFGNIKKHIAKMFSSGHVTSTSSVFSWLSVASAVYGFFSLMMVMPPTINNVTFSNPTACDTWDGRITIEASPSQPGAGLVYSYDFGESWLSVASLTDLGPGVYYIFVRDENGTDQVAYANNPVVISAPRPCVQRRSIGVVQNTQSAPLCFSGSNFPGGQVGSIGYCSIAQNGFTPILNDSCVFYQSNANFIGLDSFCVVVCDNNFPSNHCDSTIVLVNVTAPSQTVNLGIPGITPFEYCLTSAELQIGGTLLTAASCGSDPDINMTFDGQCVTFDPEDSFSGVANVCAIVCNTLGQCDSTYFNLNVGSPCLGGLLGLDTLTITSMGPTNTVCYPLSYADAFNYDFTLSGVPVNGIEPCNNDSVYFYGYALLQGQGNVGPYTLNTWQCNQDTFSGSFQTIAHLVDSMRVWDPFGNWQLQSGDLIIIGGLSGVNYSDMIITQTNTNITNTMMVNTVLVPMGTEFTVTGTGVFPLVAFDPNTNCSDTAYIEVLPFPCGNIITRTTLYAEEINGLGTVCLPLTPAQLANYSVTVNGTVVNGPFAACFGNRTEVPVGPLGTYTLRLVDINGCTDEVIIQVVPFGQNPDLRRLRTPMNTNLENICFSAASLPGGFGSLAYCGAPSNGAVPANDSCVTYIPNMGFIGIDTFCVLICDNSAPPVCNETRVIMTVYPPTDTISIVVPNTSPFDTCLATAGVIQLNGSIASATTCNAPAGISVTVADDCVQLDYDDTFTGNNLLVCVVMCDSGTPSFCDTTYIETFLGAPCPTVLPSSSINVPLIGNTGTYCLPIRPSQINQYNITINGMSVAGPFIPCGNTTGIQYDFSSAIAIVGDLPFQVTGWDVNGFVNIAQVQSLPALLDSMNNWDPFGNWVRGTMANTYVGGAPGSSYGTINIMANNGMMVALAPSQVQIATGVELTFTGVGPHVLTVNNLQNGCTESATVTLSETNTTLNITTLVNTATDTICVDLTGLAGTIDSIALCDSPMNGTLVATSPGCYVYTPNNNYLGMDNFCIYACDMTGDCDSTFVNINVLPICGAIFGDNQQSVTIMDCTDTIAYCVAIPLNDINNYTVTIDGNNINSQLVGCDNDSTFFYSYASVIGLFAGGDYDVTWMDNASNAFMATVNDPQSLTDSLNAWYPMGNWSLDANELRIVGAGLTTNTGFGTLGITQVSSGTLTNINLNVDVVSNGVAFSVGVGVYEVIVTETVTGCADSLMLSVVCDPTGCPPITAPGGLMLQAADCDSPATLCLNITAINLATYQLFDNGMPLVNNPVTCSATSGGVNLLPGIHELVLVDTLTMCRDTLMVEVDCPCSLEDTEATFTLGVGGTDTYCLDQLCLNVDNITSVMDMCADNSMEASFVYDTLTHCITITGLMTGLDSACYQVCIDTTCIDLTLFANVGAPCGEIFDIDFVGAGVSDCDSLSGGAVCLPIGLIDFNGLEMTVNGMAYSGTVSGCDFDSTYFISYQAFPGGGLAGPYRVQEFTINGVEFTAAPVADVFDLVDSLNIWDPIGDWSVNAATQTIVGGSSLNTYGTLSISQISTGAEAMVGVSAVFLPKGTSIVLPLGIHSLVFTDTLTGCRDTLIATLDCIQVEVLNDTLLIGASTTYCLSTAELPGSNYTLTIGCEEMATWNATYAITNDTCVTITGATIGTDSVCFVLCDEFGVCDTTLYNLLVITDIDPPIANNDDVTTGINSPVVINVLGNDVIASLDTFYFVTLPMHGDVQFFPDGTVNFVPDQGYCDDDTPDSFTYAICNEAGCDTATVFVTIACGELEIINGFSPNDDGVNDTFVIKGLRQFPEHELLIFNRWGNRVYESKDYRNDWNGIYRGMYLPDGTYFYYLNIPGRDPLAGFLEIRR